MSSLAGLVNYSDDEGSSSSGDEAPGKRNTSCISYDQGLMMHWHVLVDILQVISYLKTRLVEVFCINHYFPRLEYKENKDRTTAKETRGDSTYNTTSETSITE